MTVEHKVVRCVTSENVEVSFHIGKIDGQYRVTKVGNARRDEFHMPMEYVSPKIAKAAEKCPSFMTFEECEEYVRKL